MKRIPYVVYDVFTDAPFGGNPLAVIPDAADLDDALFPLIAREFNFSETTFVLPPENPKHDAKVRIFTPATELRFAGHPTVGTAIALADLGKTGAAATLELGVGPIPVTVGNGRARFSTRVPLDVDDATAVTSSVFNGPSEHLRTDHHAPVIAGLGNDFVLVELTDRAALAAATANTDAFLSALGTKGGALGLYLYVREGERIWARMLEPWGGIPEDPATGSAAASLASFLGRLDGASQTFNITQGVEMGRPSQITAEVVVENDVPVEVSISGNAVRVMEGQLTL